MKAYQGSLWGLVVLIKEVVVVVVAPAVQFKYKNKHTNKLEIYYQ